MNNVFQLTRFEIKDPKPSFLIKARERLFSVVYLISKSSINSPSLEKISVILQLLQVLAFSFNINVITYL